LGGEIANISATSPSLAFSVAWSLLFARWVFHFTSVKLPFLSLLVTATFVEAQAEF
jgi:hypothetical protein